MNTEEHARDAKRQLSRQLLSKPGINGVGIEMKEDGTYELTVHIDREDEDVVSQIPHSVEEFPVRLVLSNPYQAFSSAS